jgi:Carboxypeptidase regulatory-like domain/TonB dependent receptor
LIDVTARGLNLINAPSADATTNTIATAIQIRVLVLKGVSNRTGGRHFEVYTPAPGGAGMKWKSPIVTLALACLALVTNAASVHAQAVQTSTLTGTIKDSSGAVLPGATVNVSSPAQVGGVQTSITDDQGVYRFPALHPGVYELDATLSGFKTVKRSEITLPLGTTTTIDVSLSVASVSETVQVSGEAPVLDIKSSASNTQLSDAVLQNLPTGRFQPDVINLTPGVAASVAYGGTQSSNALLMDGVDVSDPEGGTPWSFFNYNWVEQIQVVALGANAEYGGFTGVAANSIVRSGSNNVHGLLEYLTERKNWIANNTTSLSSALQQTFTPREIDSYWDTTAQIGFPIVTDKLFMFSGVQYFNRADRPAGYSGDFTTEKDPRTIHKLTWAVSPNVRAEGFLEYDRYNLHGRGANATHPTTDTTAVELSPEWNWNGQITWTINAKTMLNVRNGGYTGYFPIEPTPPASRSGPYPRLDGTTGIHSGNIVSFGQFDRNRNVTAATLTRYADNFAGKSHEFKFGAEFERSKIRNESGYPGGRYYYDSGGPYQVYLWDGYVVNATGKRTTVYAQDTWTLTDRLTANIGLRLDVNRGSVPSGTVLKTHGLAPRAGVAFDVTGDHKTVLRGNFGRYYDALFGGQFEFMDLSQQSDYVTADVISPNNFRELNRRTPSANVGIDPNIRQSYVDQFLGGIERQLLPDFSLTAQVISRRFKDFMGFIDTGSVYAPVQKPDPGPDGRAGTSDDGQSLTVYNLTNPGSEFDLFTNPANAFRNYKAFQLIGTKRYSSNWQASLSYTWSRTEGTVNNIGGTNSAGTATNFQSLGPTGQFTDPNHFINADGPSTFDYTSQVKLDGTYRVPAFGGFNVSAVYRYTTGLAWGRVLTVRGLDQGNETVRIEPRGTRRTDPINNLDFRAEKTFPIGAGDRRIGVYLDIFNINNQGVIDSTIRTSVIDTSGSTFGNPNSWISPRLARLGFRFTF